MENITRLTIRQQAAMRTLFKLEHPSSLRKIIANSESAFDGMSQLRTVLDQLVSRNEVSLQSNNQYRISTPRRDYERSIAKDLGIKVSAITEVEIEEIKLLDLPNVAVGRGRLKLKTDVLKGLAEVLGNDISEVLLSIADDLAVASRCADEE
jgi:hypothetical protein